MSQSAPGDTTRRMREVSNPLNALNRARQAWENTQPQLVIDGWADALEATDTFAHLSVGGLERVPTSLVTRSNQCGTEPSSDRRLTASATGSIPHASPFCRVGSSVPHNNNEGGTR